MEAGSSRNRSVSQKRTPYNRFLNHKVNQHDRVWPAFLLLTIFSQLSFMSFAQTSSSAFVRQVHGSVVTMQGQPVPDATVEMRDLRGIEMGRSFTDSAGEFVIPSSAQPGQYIVVAARKSQMRDTQVSLVLNDVEVRIALPDAVQDVTQNASLHVVSAATLGVPEKARRQLQIAQKEFSKGNFAAAAQQLDHAVHLDPQFAQAFSMRALVNLALRNYGTAADDAERAVSLDPLDENAHAALATACNSLQQFERAQKASERALALNSDFWQARLEKAKSLYGLGQFVLALRELDLLDRDFADVHLVRGNVLMRLERRLEAAKEFNRFMRAAPDDPRNRQIERILSAMQPVTLDTNFPPATR